MRKIDSEASLREAILQLERRQEMEGAILKEQFLYTCESLKPLNMLKNTIMQASAVHGPGVRMVNTIAGLAAGYLSRILVKKITRSPFKTIFGNAAMLGIVNIVEKNPALVVMAGRGIINLFRKRKLPYHPAGK
ncbi:MAG: hypothetical protein WCK34_01535 [Bacteroidota bacterium]